MSAPLTPGESDDDADGIKRGSPEVSLVDIGLWREAASPLERSLEVEAREGRAFGFLFPRLSRDRLFRRGSNRMSHFDLHRETFRRTSVVVAGLPILLGLVAVVLSSSQTAATGGLMQLAQSVGLGTGLALAVAGTGILCGALDRSSLSRTLGGVLIGLAPAVALTNFLAANSPSTPAPFPSLLVPSLLLLGIGCLNLYPASRRRRATLRAACGSAVIAISATAYLWGAFPTEMSPIIETWTRVPVAAGLGSVALGAAMTLLGWRDAGPVLRSRLSVLPFAAFVVVINLFAVAEMMLP
jgi:hypothetical protein